MKIRKLKTRIAAFGLAMLMGISPMSSAMDVFAAEESVPELRETELLAETEAVEPQSEEEARKVTAEDITKEVSDEEFMVETCVEGIHYDAEKEDVTLESIEREDGGAYHPDQAGTYIATYFVVPKDATDIYTITRKVVLTDSEGQAHTEENGGQKQKEDTESEDDSDSPVQAFTEVEITASDDTTAQALAELEEDIASGNVMLFSGAERVAGARASVHLEQGETIYDPS